MASVLKNLGVGIVCVLPVVAIASGAYYWSEPQRLKRACLDAALQALVAPSTAVLADFKLLEPGNASSPVNRKLSAKLDVANAKSRAAHEASAKANEEMIKWLDVLKKEAGGFAGPDYPRFQRATTASVELAEKSTEASADRNRAEKELDDYHARRQSEIVLQIDAQNRSGAMLRSEGVCTYSTDLANGSGAVSTVSLVQIEQR